MDFLGHHAHPSAADTFLQTVITAALALHSEDSSKEPSDAGTLGELVPREQSCYKHHEIWELEGLGGCSGAIAAGLVQKKRTGGDIVFTDLPSLTCGGRLHSGAGQHGPCSAGQPAPVCRAPCAVLSGPLPVCSTYRVRAHLHALPSLACPSPPLASHPCPPA